MQQPKPRRHHPILRGFMCLFLGGMAWWCAQSLLAPKPIWTIDRTRFDTVFLPMTESGDGEYVVAMERTCRTGPVLKQAAITVLDQKTGKVLHETPDAISHEEAYDSPRLIGESVWRLTGANPNHELALRRWRFKKGRSEEILHQWNRLPGQFLAAEWSQDCNRLLLQFTLRYRDMLLLPLDGLPRLCFAAFTNEVDFRLSWWESWSIPVDENDEPRFLGRWFPHSSRWGELGTLSPDGKLIAFGDIFPNKLSYRHQIGEQKALKGEALLDVFRKKPAGCLIYDTSTGELKHHLKQTGYFYLRSFWYGNTLLHIGYETDERIVTPEEIYHPTVNGFVFYSLANEKNTGDQFLDNQVLTVTWPEELAHCDLHVKVVNHVLVVEKEIDEGQSDVFMLRQQAQSLLIQHELRKVCHLNGFSSVWMQEGCDQMFALEMPYPDPLSVVRGWLSKLPWFKKWNPDNDRDYRAIYYLYSPQTQSRYGIPLGQACLNAHRPNLKHLYLMSYETEEDGDRIDKTLSCFQMPYVIYSPWWGIGLGVVVAVLAWRVLSASLWLAWPRKMKLV